MSVETEASGSVLLIDPLELRSSGLRLLLAPWCEAVGLQLLEVSAQAARSVGQRDARLAIVVTGSGRLDSHVRELLTSLRAHQPGIGCIVLSECLFPQDVISVASLGVQACLSMATSPAVFRQALAFILAGGTYFPREALVLGTDRAGGASARLTRLPEGLGAGLTDRQTAVLECLRYGKSNKAIARQLNLQEATVKVHVGQILRKLGASNRTQAALLALCHTTLTANEPAGWPTDAWQAAIVAKPPAQSPTAIVVRS